MMRTVSGDIVNGSQNWDRSDRSQSGIYKPERKNEVLSDKKDPCPQRSGECHSPKSTGYKDKTV